MLTLIKSYLVQIAQIILVLIDNIGTKEEGGEGKKGEVMWLEVSLLIKRKLGQFSVLSFQSSLWLKGSH